MISVNLHSDLLSRTRALAGPLPCHWSSTVEGSLQGICKVHLGFSKGEICKRKG